MARTYSTNWFFEREFADGTIDRLNLLGEFILSQVEGIGSVPVEYFTQQSALGEGLRVTGYSLGERNLIFNIIAIGNSSAEERDENRRRLLDFARPNQYKPVQAIVSKPSGARYSISIYPAEGAVFSPDGSAGVNFQEPTTWVSYNPIWYHYDTTRIELPFDLPDAPISTNVGYSTSINGREVTFRFNVPTSNRAEGTIRYLYNFGDGDFSTYPIVTHIYQATGTYKHRLTITNEVANYSSTLESITVN